ncbi:MAG: AraC family transcriptional regulator [Verrucomicrobiia bacterium]
MKSSEIEPSKAAARNFSGYQPGSGESEAVRKIEQSITYMLRHLDKSLQVATLASRANISPSHFFVLFKRQIGCAPIDYFIRLRMQHACHLLDETMLSVKEVAATLGYEDPFYFSRVFKSVHHVAPSEYRLLKNGVREAVRSCGINPQPASAFGSGAGPKPSASYPEPNPAGVKSRVDIHPVVASRYGSGENAGSNSNLSSTSC